MNNALLISTYNWPDALHLVLKSVEKQSVKPDEILIADDGSSNETKDVIDIFKKLGLPIKHIWQEDDGFKRTSILNKAIAASKADYIIQIDGDCIIHEKFVEDHLILAKDDTFLFGSRVNIKENAVAEVFQTEQTRFNFTSNKISRKTRNLHVPLFRDLYTETTELSKKVRGCNLSFWRKDFISINGYNEEMTGWGKEDSEMIIRLLNSGVKGKRLRYGGILYHIWHKASSRSQENINEKIEAKTAQENLKRCAKGIDQYL
ncbi:glycosyltransferase family 2 protein [Gramella sp. AN32]|uniref:Glycosyltransferase family 2 protein n=1 Tax=Christiangramia antarctica TaxID=2058158 RepID=A0ABW5X716_9FLAO|nr:glycosyltransferase family 2 protein [Gramella sp. AN32]MCM4154561.1 glycosyl transferase [Gramella sp. AN32]